MRVNPFKMKISLKMKVEHQTEMDFVVNVPEERDVLCCEHQKKLLFDLKIPLEYVNKGKKVASRQNYCR